MTALPANREPQCVPDDSPRARAPRILGIAVGLLAMLASFVLLASPASASAAACGNGAKCFYVGGSGSHVYPRVGMKLTTGPGAESNYGHMQIRWNAGGSDHFQNSNSGYISNQGYIYMNVDFTVTANTYVCGRWWSWTGSTYVLRYGDWTCVKTHP